MQFPENSFKKNPYENLRLEKLLRDGRNGIKMKVNKHC